MRGRNCYSTICHLKCLFSPFLIHVQPPFSPKMTSAQKLKIRLGILIAFIGSFMLYSFLLPATRFYSREHYFYINDPPIFLIETSGASTFNTRQGCAIESTALHNPSMDVYAFLTSTTKFEDDLLKSLSSIPNVHILRVSIDDLVYNSPIENWYKEGKWKLSKWKVPHLSDALRLLLILKYGGIYLDMDIVTLKPLRHLRNSVITENWITVANGILIFDKDHELIRRTITDFVAHYNPNTFALNGPTLLTNNIKKLCKINALKEVSNTDCDTNVLPPEIAFPIPWNKWRDYFMPSTEKIVSEFYNSSYMIHVWNMLSHGQSLTLGNNSIYELAIKQNCPSMYRHALKSGVI